MFKKLINFILGRVETSEAYKRGYASYENHEVCPYQTNGEKDDFYNGFYDAADEDREVNYL